MTDLATWLLTCIDEDKALINNWGDWTDPWSPSRVLAECDAKRKIVELCTVAMVEPEMDEVLKLLALPYADRPGYLAEWRP